MRTQVTRSDLVWGLEDALTRALTMSNGVNVHRIELVQEDAVISMQDPDPVKSAYSVEVSGLLKEEDV